MEAKDKRIQDIVLGVYEGCRVPSGVYEVAEISFKAGQESIGDYPDQISQARKAGMMKVVEWAKKYTYGRVVDKKTHIHKLRIEIPLEDWQAFLKKNGLEGK